MARDEGFVALDWVQELIDLFAANYGWRKADVFDMYWEESLRLVAVIRRRKAAEQIDRMDAARYARLDPKEAKTDREAVLARTRAGLRYVPIEERVDPATADRMREIERKVRRDA